MIVFNYILFVGGGNMTRAIVSGLISDGYSPTRLLIVDRHADKREFFENTYQVKTADQLTAALLDVDMIVLSVKPQGARSVCAELKPLLHSKIPLILSVMAGLTLDTLQSWLGDALPIVRAMPNTPSLIKAGATGLVSNALVSAVQKEQVQALMSVMGIVAWLEQEAQLEAITALSGSGPAYFFYFMEAMQAVAIKLGLPESIAQQFALQTAYGAAKLAMQSDESVATLRSRVTSKGGTTAAALAVFEQQGLPAMVESAMRAAQQRSRALSQEFGV